MDQQPSSSQKLILDDHQGLSNDMDLTNPSIMATLNSVLSNIDDLLSNIYGNKAHMNLIINDTYGQSKLTSSKYTSDGINSLEAYDFASPMERHIANLIAYVGRRVDSSAHDGTTSSMLFVTKLLRYVLVNFRLKTDHMSIGERQKHADFFASFLTDLFKSIITSLEKSVIKDGNKEDFRNLVMTTTKGNEELTNILVDILYSVPEEVFPMIVAIDSPIETNYMFKRIDTDEDYAFPITSFSQDDFNDTIQTTFTSNEPHVLIMTQVLDPVYTESMKRVINASLKSHPDKDIVILSCKDQLGGVYRVINDIKASLNDLHIPVYACEYTPTQVYLRDKLIELKMFNVMTGTKPLSEHCLTKENDDDYKDYFVKPEKLTCDALYMKFFNTYPKINGYVHAWLNDERYPEYNKIYQDLTKHRNDTINNNKKEYMTTELKGLTYLIKAFVAYKAPQISIGGRTNDIPAHGDILNDARGVINSAKKSGIIIDGFLKMLWLFSPTRNEDLLDNVDIEFKELTEDFLEYMCFSIQQMLNIVIEANEITCIDTNPVRRFVYHDDRCALRKVFDRLLGKKHEQCFTEEIESPILDDLITEIYLYASDDGTKVDETTVVPCRFDLYTLYSPSFSERESPKVLQTFELYRELFKCIGEVVPRLVKTKKILVNNAVIKNERG